jgi:type I restriction enzyme S subunit
MASDFIIRRLDDLAEIVGGGTPPTGDPENYGGSIPWITPRDLSDYRSRFISRGERNITEKGMKASATRYLPKGSVLFTSRAPIGYVAIAANPVTTNQGFKSLVPKDTEESEFLYYLMRFATPLIQSISAGSTFPEVSGGALKNVAVAVPCNKAERVKIGGLLGSLDSKIDMNRQINETLEGMARAIFKDWFVDFGPVRAKAGGRLPPGLPPDIAALFPDKLDDDDKPDGWVRCPLSDVVAFNPSERLSKGMVAPYLEMAALPTRGLWPDAPVLRAASSGSRFKNGDTLFARITPCLENGKTAYVQCMKDGEIGWGSTEFIVIRPKMPFPSEYGYLLARDSEFRAYAIQSMSGTSGRQRVQTDSLSTFSIVRPSREILDCFSAIVRPWFATIIANERQSQTLSALRDLLLAKLMSGEVRLKESGSVAQGAA